MSNDLDKEMFQSNMAWLMDFLYNYSCNEIYLDYECIVLVLIVITLDIVCVFTLRFSSMLYSMFIKSV